MKHYFWTLWAGKQLKGGAGDGIHIELEAKSEAEAIKQAKTVVKRNVYKVVKVSVHEHDDEMAELQKKFMKENIKEGKEPWE